MAAGRLRVDELELELAVQAEVADIWEQINTDNLKTLADFEGYRQEFLQLFGFGVMGVDYDADVNPEVSIAQLVD
jgi:enoyl-[acyl-carrier protein] reductase/trans-2-enoyl-CoA reductase (NAD+)